MTASPHDLARYLIRLSRPQNVVYSGLLAVGGAYVSDASPGRSLACYGFFLSVYALAAGYNNVRDVRADRMNRRRDNPLVGQAIPPVVLRSFFVIHLVILALLQVVLAQPVSFVLTLIYLGLNVAYSHKELNVQARGFMATLTLATCYGSLPLLFGLAQGDVLDTRSWTFVLFQIFLLFPVLLAKDYKDVYGDRTVGKRTPLVRYGPELVFRVALSCAVLAAGFYIALVIWLGLNSFFALVACEIYVLFCYQLHRTKGRLNGRVRRLANFLLLGMSLYILTGLR